MHVNHAKIQRDLMKIELYKVHGVVPYSHDKWVDWTGRDYIKSFYDIKLPDGTVLLCHWVNAGRFIVGDITYDKDSGIQVKLSGSSPH